MDTIQVNNYLPVDLPPPACVVPDNVPESDGEPMDTPWHRSEIQILIESVRVHLRGRSDYFVGGNTFLYYTEEQWATPESLKEAKFRGPDFFFVDGVDGAKPRLYWVVFREGGRYPDVIIELLSPSTESVDRTVKKQIYERTFKTVEYFVYDPDKMKLEGWRHDGAKYHALQPDEKGFLFCEKLKLWLGTWVGSYLDEENTWLRFFDEHFQMVPLEVELKGQELEAEHRKAEGERRKAEELAQSLAVEQQRVAAQQARSPAFMLCLPSKTLRQVLRAALSN
jgi:Uma2 family endonuclease